MGEKISIPVVDINYSTEKNLKGVLQRSREKSDRYRKHSRASQHTGFRVPKYKTAKYNKMFPLK